MTRSGDWRPVWREEFEDLLDEQLAVHRPAWRVPALPERHVGRPDPARYWRCNVKRAALASALREDPERVRSRRSDLLHLIVHDLDPSRNEQLTTPVVRALGHQEVDEALLRALESGTFVERVGALKAWYSAQPGLAYETMSAFHRGEPTADSALAHARRSALQARYDEACRRAVEACPDPDEREYLLRWIGAPTIVSIGRPGTDPRAADC